MKERLAPLLTWPDVSHRWMFGTDCFLVGGRMFLFFPAGDHAAFKLPESDRGRLLALPGGGPFVMTRGAAFGSWVQAPLSSLDGRSLIEFARAACEHVRASPRAKPRRRARSRNP